MTAGNNIIQLACHQRNPLPDLEKKWRSLLGELIVATGADNLSLDVLAGVLIAAVETTDEQDIATWAARGAHFFANDAANLR
jgi:hypothetical protein